MDKHARLILAHTRKAGCAGLIALFKYGGALLVCDVERTVLDTVCDHEVCHLLNIGITFAVLE